MAAPCNPFDVEPRSWLGPSAPIKNLTKSATFHQSACDCDESEELLYPRLSVTHKAREVQRLNDTMKRSPKKGRTDALDRMPGLLGHHIDGPAGGKLVALLRHVQSPQEESNQKQSIHLSRLLFWVGGEGATDFPRGQ